MVDLALLRTDLATALQGVTAVVDGQPVELSAYPVQPHPVNAYDAWPAWQTVRPVAMCVQEVDWHVCVALPAGDITTTVAAGDALLDPVADALAAYQLVTVQPGQLVVADAGTVPILIFAIVI
jgi:hypothetical protein